tara:strand:+ start:938 stop:1807 length:870 start_codon:yes stop_codon:yes gene_type:complete
MHKSTISLLKVFLLSFFITSMNAIEIYEAFDFKAKNNTGFREGNLIGGLTSAGWMSSWTIGDGTAKYVKDSLVFSGLESNGGSAKVIGERKENFIGKGSLLRQMSVPFTGTVYGSFRVLPAHFMEDSIFGLIFTLPNAAEFNPRNALFSICPKRWGSSYGAVGVGKKVFKIQNGVPCEKNKKYLVLWKMTHLPEIGSSDGVTIAMWVLNEYQVEHFSENGFDERDLNLAASGKDSSNVLQIGRMNVKDSKYSLYKGVLLSPFTYNTTSVVFDEVRISTQSFAEAVGIDK